MNEERCIMEELKVVASRIKELREIAGLSEAKAAELTGVSLSEYIALENGEKDFYFTFIYKCAQAFNVEIKDIVEGSSPTLTKYNLIRKGEGMAVARREGFSYVDLAPAFRNKAAEPFRVTIPSGSEKSFSTHEGQELDIVISGKLKIQIGDRVEVLNEGDSIYYNSSVPHALAAAEGDSCEIYAIVLRTQSTDDSAYLPKAYDYKVSAHEDNVAEIVKNFIACETDENGVLTSINFKNDDSFNFV